MCYILEAQNLVQNRNTRSGWHLQLVTKLALRSTPEVDPSILTLSVTGTAVLAYRRLELRVSFGAGTSWVIQCSAV